MSSARTTDTRDADARRWGIEPAALTGAEQAEDAVWPEHRAAVDAFLSVQTQWRVAVGLSGVVYQGLDYGAARAGLEMAGVIMTPDLWDEIRMIEIGAKNALNGVAE